MLDADLKAQLAAYMEKLAQPVELVASLDDSDKSRELDAQRRAQAVLRDRARRHRCVRALRRRPDGP